MTDNIISQGPGDHSPGIGLSPYNATISKWALPYAEQIRDAEDCFKTGRLQEALSLFFKILEDIPDAAIVLMNIAVCFGELGQKSDAKSFFKRCLEVIPGEFRSLAEENMRRLEQT